MFLVRYRSAVVYTLVLSIGLFAGAASAWAQIALVNVTSCGPSAFPGSCTIPASGSGHLMVVAWETGGGSNTSTTITRITDNAGNAYVEATGSRAIDSSVNDVVDVWYAKNSIAGATSITVTPSASVTRAGVVVWEFSGIDATAPLDNVAELSSQPANASPTAPTVAATAASDAVVSLAAVSSSLTGISSGNPFTSDATVFSNGWSHLITSTPGSYGAHWNQDAAGTYASSTVSFKSASTGSGALNACDLNQDSVVNVLDAQLAINMYLGVLSCSANIEGAGVCNSDVVNRVIAGALGGACDVTTVSYSAVLNWTASAGSNIAGYNVYRGTISGGPYVKQNSSLAPATNYSDATVQNGQTYYYVVTAVDTGNNESGYSTEAKAQIPST